MLHFAWMVFRAATVVLLADFITGTVHWIEDAYFRSDSPVIGKLFIQPNILHHQKPRHFAQFSWLHSSWDLALLNLAIVLCAWQLGHLTWEVWLFAIIATNANEIHKWAHRTPRENGRIITSLQRAQVIQSARHHARHHTDPKNSHYCTVTPWLNPVLDTLRLWDVLEGLIAATLHVRRRVDETVRMDRRVEPVRRPHKFLASFRLNC